MLQQVLKLKDIAEPWDKTKKMKNLNLFPYEATLADLNQLEEGKDIGLEQDGEIIAWIPFQRLVLTLFQAWKMTLAYYEALLLSISDAVTGVNANGDIVTWNTASEQFYGFKTQEVLGQPITKFFQEDAVVLKQTLNKGLKIKHKYNQPIPNVHVLINATPVYMEGRLIGGISVERDISDVVRLNEELSTTKAYIHDLENKYEKNYSVDPFGKIKGKSHVIKETIAIAKKVAKTDATVLITGESGVGKELFAEAIHKGSRRADLPFVAINCGAIPASLFESELFGYEKGAFTGAIKEGKKGKIDLAKGGTLFLDEVGELPLDLQVKLLRVLQEKQFYRLGGNTAIPVDVRIITATNRNLEEMVATGKFREDLYYRLNVISLYIPPLRERAEDIPDLLTLFLKEFSFKYDTNVPKISAKVMSIFLHDEWRGNIRQLRNVAERLIILAGEEERIEPYHLHHILKKGVSVTKKQLLDSTLDEAKQEEWKIRQALQTTYRNKSAAAKMLGISRATLYNKMKKYGID
ncbi:sigma-54-dependent Fis family transcriptional regulator [Tepidibacillus sp. HK-1]|uniref:sigma-54 interaction domain-containing protein n=1 Tax=Tepidibacillus sp. HK-1 TaxID=1883407 RepID=UPI000852AED4|nr:sigma 54-interacting transcriptional regulator [Tepidibacillus sp. HK-1]GBF10776.1 limonene hydroxylase [Tepidibacillus sp. HK-1]